jgi:hypothetical protein
MDYLKLAGAGAITVSAVTTATYLYLTQSPDPVPLAADVNDQSTEIKVNIHLLCFVHKTYFLIVIFGYFSQLNSLVIIFKMLK